jgi:F-type H+-transporting ATPase subunit delta
MANIEQESQSIAEVYASALLELAVEKNQDDDIESELSEVAKLIADDADFARFMASPTVPEDSRAVALEKAFRGKMNDQLLNTLLVMNRKGRAGLVRALAEAFRLLLEDRKGEVDVVVRSAVKLDDASKDRVRKAVAAHVGKQPRLIENVDESLIGGLVLQIGDEKLDTSVALRLSKMRHAFLERASREIRERSYFEENAA